MTREELIAKLARTRAAKLALTWAQFTSSVQALSPQIKAELLQAVNTGNEKAIAIILGRAVKRAKVDLAMVEVTAIAADDNVTIDELINLLG